MEINLKIILQIKMEVIFKNKINFLKGVVYLNE